MKVAISQYQRTYDLEAPLRQNDQKFGAHLAYFKGTPVVLAMPMTKSLD
jgi:hypothetical protein